MKKTYFLNNGLLDTRAFRVMGMSAKNSDSAIGQFGTGLKYAIAGVLRTGGEIKIETGENQYLFYTEETTFRDQQFDQVFCNGEELPFTTEYGKHWEPWQWLRELHSNAIDEGGKSSFNDSLNDQFETVITVEHDDVYECRIEIDKYFLPKSARKIAEHRDCQVFESVGNDAVYYKGVKIAEWEDMMFTYNLTENCNVELTEDRTLQYDWYAREAIARGLALLVEPNHVKFAISEQNAHFNGLRSEDEISEPMIEMVKSRLEENPNAKLPNGMRQLYIQRAGTFTRNVLEFTPRQLKQLEKVKAFLSLIDFEVTAPIVKVESKGDSLYGQASDNGEIWLTEKAFEHGTFDLAATLLEEHVHLATKHRDESRGLQDYLFRQIIIMGENQTDEIL